MTKQDVDNINTERMNSYREGQVIDMQGSKYKFDGNSIAQSIASGNDTGNLQTVADLHHDMNAWKNHAEKIARYGDRQGEHKEEYERANAEYEKYKADYNQALTAYSFAAADGLSNVASISKTTNDSSSISESNSFRDSEQAKFNAGGVLGVGEGIAGSVGVGYSTSTEKSTSISNQNEQRFSIQSSRNELQERVRHAVTDGLNKGLNTEQIISNINNNLLSK